MTRSQNESSSASIGVVNIENKPGQSKWSEETIDNVALHSGTVDGGMEARTLGPQWVGGAPIW